MVSESARSFTSASEEETAQLAERVAACLKGGEYLSLEGDLGAGKTFFSRALAHALGIMTPITSPTFVIQKIYSLPPNRSIKLLVHYDFYRITDYQELVDLGFEDHDSRTIVLAEWGNLYQHEFPVQPVRIQFETLHDDRRLITITGLSLN